MKIEGGRSVKSYQADQRGGKEGNFLPNFLHSRLIKPFLAPPKTFPSPFCEEKCCWGSEGFRVSVFIMIDCHCGKLPMDLIDGNSDVVRCGARACV